MRLGSRNETFNLTICFIKNGDKILMLNRRKAPNMGLWNGVGGKIDEGETPEACILREIYEETGLKINEVKFGGIVTWTDATQYYGGMYLYSAEYEGTYEENAQTTREGILHWKEIDWILHPDNYGIVSNIREFLPNLLNDSTCYEYECFYDERGILADVRIMPLEVISV